MAQHAIRVYGHVAGLTRDVFDALDRDFGFQVFEFDGDELSLEFEGAWFFLDEFLEALAPQLPEGAQGRVDCIDHDEWTMRRVRIEGGQLSEKIVDLNDVLERYSQE